MAYKRKHYFIDRRYQGRITLMIIFISAAGMFLDLGIFNYIAYSNIESWRWRTHLDIFTVSDLIRSYLIYSSIFSVFITAAVLFIYLKFAVRKTEGPIYRLNKDIGAAAEGNLSLNIWLRKDDDFKETAVELDRMVAAIREDFRRISEGFADIQKTVNILEHVSDKPEIAVEKCRQLIEYIGSLRNIER